MQNEMMVGKKDLNDELVSWVSSCNIVKNLQEREKGRENERKGESEMSLVTPLPLLFRNKLEVGNFFGPPSYPVLFNTKKLS